MSFNPDVLKTLFDKRDQYVNTSITQYLKLSAGIHQIRFCGPWNATCNTPIRFALNHGSFDFPLKDKDGFGRQPLCMKYVFENPDIVNALISKLTKEKIVADYNIFTKEGCLGCRLQEIFKNSGKKIKFLKPNYYTNVILRSDGKCYVWNTPGAALDAIKMIYPMYPDLFDPNKGIDFNVSATGEKLSRKYVVSPINSPCPQGSAELHDLDQVMADGYRSYSEMIELINNTYPQVLPMLGVTPNMVATPTTPF